MTRYPKPYEGIRFEDRTPGDIMAEFYMVVAAELDQLRSKVSELSASEIERLAELEDVLRPTAEGRMALRGLSKAEADQVIATAHRTGDPLVDYWERQVALGRSIDLDQLSVPSDGR